MVRRIRVLPDDEEVLRSRAIKVKRVDAHVAQLVQDLKDTFAQERAYGLSAPQIGASRRIILFRGEEDGAPVVLINPKILRAEGEEKDYDGCLSIPGIYARTRRASRIVVTAQDEFGEPLRRKFQGFTARIVQHEIDHLDGILFIDRLDSLDDLYRLERVEGKDEAEERPLAEAELRFVERHRRELPSVALTW